MPPRDNDVEIAILREQLQAIREQQKRDAEQNKDLFNKLFNKIDILESTLNRGKGVFAAALTFAGIGGGVIATLLDYMTKR